MKQIIRLAWSYLKYYRKQTMALFLGIVLSCALFTGIGSLQKSGNHAARENARTKSGDWHYTMRCDTDWFEEFEKTYQPGEKEQGYCVEKTGVLTMRKVTEEPYEIELDYAEEGYLSMMGRTVKEGRYPEEEGEAALDEFTLRNLDIPRKIGTTFTLDGETFTLCATLWPWATYPSRSSARTGRCLTRPCPCASCSSSSWPKRACRRSCSA